MLPMLASANDEGAPPPAGESWLHEVKWDGMRVLAEVLEGELRVTSRNGNAVSLAYPELERGEHLPADVLLDGEVVAITDGRPSFSALASRMHVRQKSKAKQLAAANPVTFMAFDVLRLYGVDLLTMPMQERRGVLERLELGGPDGPAARWQSPPAYDDGAILWAATEEQGLEGVVSKRRQSVYRAGRRSKDWVKSAHRRTDSCVVVGWSPQTGSTTIGSLWVALPDGQGGWLPLGRVGSGVAATMAQDLLRQLKPLATATCPLAELPPDPDVGRAQWVEPKVIVDVRHLGHNEGGRLRQPVLRGLRTDLSLDDLRQEG